MVDGWASGEQCKGLGRAAIGCQRPQLGICVLERAGAGCPQAGVRTKVVTAIGYRAVAVEGAADSRAGDDVGVANGVCARGGDIGAVGKDVGGGPDNVGGVSDVSGVSVI